MIGEKSARCRIWRREMLKPVRRMAEEEAGRVCRIREQGRAALLRGYDGGHGDVRHRLRPIIAARNRWAEAYSWELLALLHPVRFEAVQPDLQRCRADNVRSADLNGC